MRQLRYVSFQTFSRLNQLTETAFFSVPNISANPPSEVMGSTNRCPCGTANDLVSYTPSPLDSAKPRKLQVDNIVFDHGLREFTHLPILCGTLMPYEDLSIINRGLHFR